MTQQPRITIVFPPAADPALPHGALPLLAAVLRRAGYDSIDLRDLNLEAFEALLRPEDLRRSLMEAPPAPALLDTAAEAIEHTDEALRILRNPTDFYHPGKLIFAKRIFHLACSLVTVGHERLAFGKYSYSSSRYDSFEDILSAIRTDSGPLGRYFREHAVPSLLTGAPDVIGISVAYFSQLIPAFILAEAIRERDPGVHLTFGGPVITWGKEVLAADVRFSRWLDSFFVGEADETLVWFIEALDGKRDIAAVPNVVRYDRSRVVDQSRAGYQVNLDRLPTPDYSLMPMDRYLAPRRVICMVPTRGCYFNKCAFCNYAFIKLAPYRMRSAHLVAQDIVEVKRATGEDVFCLESDVILPEHLRALSEALIAADAGIKWHGVARFENGFTPAIFSTMRQAGCVRLYMGLESANDRVLKAMRKGTNARRMTAILQMCHRAGITVEAGVFTGFPTETQAEAFDTYGFVLKHRDAIGRADVGTFRLLKGAPIAEQPHLYGISIIDDPRKRWYHLESPTRPDTAIIQRIQQLYPEVALVDVPEDLLYTAHHGPNIMRQVLHTRTHPTIRDVDIVDTDRLMMPKGSSVERIHITNSGAVHFRAAHHPVFEASSVTVPILVHRERRAIYPLSPEEDEALMRIGPQGRRAAEIWQRIETLRIPLPCGRSSLRPGPGAAGAGTRHCARRSVVCCCWAWRSS